MVKFKPRLMLLVVDVLTQTHAHIPVRTGWILLDHACGDVCPLFGNLQRGVEPAAQIRSETPQDDESCIGGWQRDRQDRCRHDAASAASVASPSPPAAAAAARLAASGLQRRLRMHYSAASTTAVDAMRSSTKRPEVPAYVDGVKQSLVAGSTSGSPTVAVSRQRRVADRRSSLYVIGEFQFLEDFQRS